MHDCYLANTTPKTKNIALLSLWTCSYLELFNAFRLKYRTFKHRTALIIKEQIKPYTFLKIE